MQLWFLFKPWQVSSIGDDIPGESHCYVFVVDQPIAIVPEVVLGVHAENGINLEILERMGLQILPRNHQIPAIVEHGIFAPENNLVPQNNLETLIYSLKICKTTRMDFKIQPGSVCCWASDIQRWDKGTAVSRSSWRGDWDRPEMSASASAEGCLISIQLLKYEQRGHET